MDIVEYLDRKNLASKFKVKFNRVGGNITFSNSGKSGQIKEFTLSIESFINTLNDIIYNINIFKGHLVYSEKEWRDLGSRYFLDGPTNTLSTVQTKPLFTTLSKIITWANYPNLEHINTDTHISIEFDLIINTIKRLEAEYDKIKYDNIEVKTNNINSNIVICKEKILRLFAIKVFTHFYGNEWYDIIKTTTKNPSRINDINFYSHDFGAFKRLLGEFSFSQSRENLTTSNTTRYFEEPILIQDNKYYYFTTQWSGNGNYSLSFLNLKSHFENTFSDYRLKRKDGYYYLMKIESVANKDFQIILLKEKLHKAGLIYSQTLITRFTSSLLTKPFVILTGLSGSGKTKLAQAFAKWICQDESQYCLLPVGADWTNREPLLGYPNALKPEEYIKPDNGVLDLILQANNHHELPHFLILDEMNLSLVERYFADFLSAMESGEEISLYSDSSIENGVPSNLKIPSNIYIIGTVNIDETTNMFSPKVLDRANTIEFRVTKDEMKNFLNYNREIDLDSLVGQGADMAISFQEMSENTSLSNISINTITESLIQFFGELKKAGAEFGYRSATEILRLIHNLTVLDDSLTTNQKIDIAIMQKLLPKLHGSRRKLCPILETIGSFCISEHVNINKDVFDNTDFDFDNDTVRFPLSLEKISRMYRGAIDNGFASFAEA